MSLSRFLVLVTMIVAAVVTRLLPHPSYLWNVSPIGAMALFGGACFASRWLAFFVPLAVLLVSDLFLGMNQVTPVVYASFALYVLLGRLLRSHRSVGSTVAVTLVGSIQFYLITNFACWALPPADMPPFYPPTLAGLMTCYIAAIPFFWGTLVGDLTFVAALFGGLALAERGFPRLREPVAQPALA
jgi:hypothetical protein